MGKVYIVIFARWKMADLSELRNERELIRIKILEGCVSEVRKLYAISDERIKGILVDDLEQLVDKYESLNKHLEQLPQTPSPIHFDAATAKRIRIGAEITQAKLAEILDIDFGQVSLWEGGRKIPTPYSKNTGLRGTGGEKYLTWLAEKGYDPYNLRPNK